MRYNKSKETERIWKEYCVDKTIDEIAEHFNVEKGYARQRCCNFGIKVKHIVTVKYAGLEDYARHHTISEAAEQYNCPKSRIYQYARRHNIEFVREPKKYGVERAVYKRTGEVRDMIVTLCDYYSYASIGRVFGYSRERIRQIWKESKKAK